MADPVGLISGAGGLSPVNPAKPAQLNRQEEPAQSFKDLLLQNLQEVNRLQQDAARATEDLAAGRRNDIENVLTATRKAELAFQMLQQVRNRVLDAYNELKDIPV